MNDTPGTPSAICVGHHPAKGERWVSPGVGERMIAYLRRTYAQPAPAERPKRAHLKTRQGKPLAAKRAISPAPERPRVAAKQIPKPPKPAKAPKPTKPQRQYPCERSCVDCGVLFTAVHPVHVRCQACARQRELYCKKIQRQNSKRQEAKVCRQCGRTFTPTHGLDQFCSDACRRTYRTQYDAKYKASLRTIHTPVTKSGICQHCLIEFTYEQQGGHGNNRRYCSERCQKAAGHARERARKQGGTP